MKRDMDLVRTILFGIEARSPGTYTGVDIYDANASDVYHHLVMLIDAGYVRGRSVGSLGTNSGQAIVEGLTWEGHDFLKAVRNDTIWAKTTEIIKKRAAAPPLKWSKPLPCRASKRKWV